MKFSTKQRRYLVFLLLVGGAFFAGYKYFGADQKSVQPDVNIPVLSAFAQQGKTVYDANCAQCHGANAVGSSKGPPFVHKIYEPNHHGDASFILAPKRGVRAHHWQFGNMPAIPGISEKDIALIIAYVREIQKANGIF